MQHRREEEKSYLESSTPIPILTSLETKPIIPCGYITFTYGGYYYPQDGINFFDQEECVLGGKMAVPLKRNEEVNPYIAEANEEVINWIIAKGLAKEEVFSKLFAREEDILKLKEKLKEMLRGVNFAGIFPTALRNHPLKGLALVSATKFISFLFLFDDIIDKNLGQLIEKLKQKLHQHKAEFDLYLELDKELKTVFQTFIEIFSGVYENSAEIPVRSEIFPKCKEFNDAFFDIYSAMRALHYEDNDISSEDVLHHLKKYLASLRQEVNNRSSDVLSVVDYRDMRITTGAVPLTFLVYAYINGLKNLREEMKNDPLKKQIFKKAAAILSFDNDFRSFEKERGEQDHANLIQVLADQHVNQKDKPVKPGQAAFDEAIRVREEDMYKYLKLTYKLRTSATEKGSDFLKFIDILDECILDNIFWDTTRYQIKGADSNCVYEEGILVEKIKSTICEGAVLITSPTSSKEIGKGLLQKLAALARQETVEAPDSQTSHYLRKIAMLAKLGILKPDEIRHLVGQFNSIPNLKNKNEFIADEFAKVMGFKSIVNISSTMFTSELLKIVSECQLILANNPEPSKKIAEVITYMFREDSIGQSFLNSLFKQEDNVKFIKEFMKKLVWPMMFPLTRDLTNLIARERNKSASQSSRWLPALDYSKDTAAILESHVRTTYLDNLTQFSTNISNVPEAMSAAANAVYKALFEEANHILSKVVNTEAVITVNFSKEELANPTTVNVQAFLVYVVGLYLNLRLLRPSFDGFVKDIRQYKSNTLLNLMEENFYHPSLGNDLNFALQEQLNQFLTIDFTKSEFAKLEKQNLISLQAKLNKFNPLTIKDELKKNLKTFTRSERAAFKNPEISSKCPILSGYLFLLINYKKLMHNYKNDLFSETIKLKNVIEDGIVDFCVQGMASLLKNNPEKEKTVQGTEVKERSNSDAKNKDELRNKIRKLVKDHYSESIIKLYAKLTVPLKNSNEYQDNLIRICLNKEELDNWHEVPLLSEDQETYLQICEETFDDPLKKVCEQKILFLSKQLAEDNPIKFSAELNNMIYFIFQASDQPSVAEQIRGLCRETLDWFERITKQKTGLSQIHFKILACLTLYAAVFDVDQCHLIQRISAITEKLEQKNYKTELAKFAMGPVKLAASFHRQQDKALQEELAEAQKITPSRYKLFAKSVTKLVKDLKKRLKNNEILEQTKANLLKGMFNDQLSITDESSPSFFEKPKKSRLKKKSSVIDQGAVPALL